MIKKQSNVKPEAIKGTIAPAPAPTPAPVPAAIARTSGGVAIRKTYVLARNERTFLIWIKERSGGRKLQDCKYISSVSDMQGIGFSDPTVELMVVHGWKEGRDIDFVESGYALISRYCLDKGVRMTPICTDL